MASHALVMQALGRAVRMFPHLRVGQLIDNAVYTRGGIQALFYMNDAELVAALNEFMDAHGG